jgi:predicted acyltransferase
MILLVSDGFGFGELIHNPVYHGIANQFHHRPWGGAVFYDLIMPAFLFMVGVAMPFSLGRRMEQGQTSVNCWIMWKSAVSVWLSSVGF